jgi:hypothetical protein
MELFPVLQIDILRTCFILFIVMFLAPEETEEELLSFVFSCISASATLISCNNDIKRDYKKEL